MIISFHNFIFSAISETSHFSQSLTITMKKKIRISLLDLKITRKKKKLVFVSSPKNNNKEKYTDFISTPTFQAGYIEVARAEILEGICHFGVHTYFLARLKGLLLYPVNVYFSKRPVVVEP